MHTCRKVSLHEGGVQTWIRRGTCAREEDCSCEGDQTRCLSRCSTTTLFRWENLERATGLLNSMESRPLNYMSPNEFEDTLDDKGYAAFAEEQAAKVPAKSKERDDLAKDDKVRLKNSKVYKSGPGVKGFENNYTRTVYTVAKVNKPVRQPTTKSINRSQQGPADQKQDLPTARGTIRSRSTP